MSAATSQATWLAELREAARSRVAEGKLPDRSALEAWRKVDLSGFEPGAYPVGDAGPGTAFALKGDGAESLKIDEALEAGGDLADFTEDALRYYATGDQATYFNAHGLAAGGERVLKLSGTSSEPILARHIAVGPDARVITPRTLVYVQTGAEVTLIEEYAFARETASDDLRLIAPMTDLYLAPGSRLNYIMLGDFDASDFHFRNFRSRQMRDSNLNVYLFPLGGLKGKHFYRNEAMEPGTECRVVGCAVGKDREFNDMDIRMEHHADHTQSSILYRSVVRDRAHHVFYGNLHIAPGLKDVDSHQTNNNILLDRRARAESMPNLIIRAEDVAAEHGATVGELDPEALYFLMARGIPEDEARSLLIEGFINSVLQEVPGEQLRADIDRRLKDRLS